MNSTGLRSSVSDPKGLLVQVAISFLQREKEPLLSGCSRRAAGKSRLPSFWSHTRVICLCACLSQVLFPYLGHCLLSLPSPESMKASPGLPGGQAFSLAPQLGPSPRHSGSVFSIFSLKFLATSWGHGPQRCLSRAAGRAPALSDLASIHFPELTTWGHKLSSQTPAPSSELLERTVIPHPFTSLLL